MTSAANAKLVNIAKAGDASKVGIILNEAFMRENMHDFSRNCLFLAAKKCYDPAIMAPVTFQKNFFNCLKDAREVQSIFEHLPGVYFFVKDVQGRHISVNSSVLQRLGLQKVSELIGKTDEDLYPPNLAAAYRADDAQVYRTGKPLVNRLEVWLDENQRPDWCVTTKLPLQGKDGRMVGLVGISRRDLGCSALQPALEATKAVDYLRQHTDEILTTAQLARAVHISERTLNRKIKQAFGVAPYELMLRIRVQAAAETLLQTSKEISEVALAHGFSDQSAFTQHFRKRMGITPRKFRMRGSRA